MNIWDITWILGLFLVQLIRADQNPLSDYVRHFEGLKYDTSLLHNKHMRAKRSVGDPYVHLKFEAHGRNFNLRLRRDTTTFAKDIDHDVSHIYEGDLWGEPGSYVHGSIIQGVFAGKIYSNKGNYFVENAAYYFTEAQPFHSVIYSEKDVIDDPYKYKKEKEKEHVGGCGNDNVRDWMHQVQNSAVPQPKIEPVESETVQKPQRLKKREVNPLELEDEFVERAHHNIYKDPHVEHGERKRRETADKNTCTLYLQSDTELWKRMTGPTLDGGLGFDSQRAQEEITSLFASHVSGIKKIYEDTIFKSYDGSDVSYSGISFVVRRVRINETERDCPDGVNTPHNFFCNPNIDVSNFLNYNSLSDHDDFCLAYVFTFRDFTGGTLGLAWVGSNSRASGGICEKWKEYQETTSRRVYKSLNTGIVTLINYKSPVPLKVSTLTFAHEVGHNFGSPHDSGTLCTPFSANPNNADGNYIMYASATSGDSPNNSKFSPCAKSNISLVLDVVMKQEKGKINCFVERESAFCGNNIVEDGEDCDCGYAEDCLDKCCHGRGVADQCRLKPSAQCSPSQGPCCNQDCTKKSRDMQSECQATSDCNEASFCDGTTATCPAPATKENRTACNKNTQICISGECRGSICQIKGWEQCYLTKPDGQRDFDKGDLCFLACQNPSLPKPQCISTGDEAALARPENRALADLLKDIGQSAIKLPPGAPCDELRGYCDVFQKCRDVDANGPLARLKKLLFNEQTFNDIRDWIIRNWWAVLLMGVGLIVLMGIFIKVCAVHTPSSNPKKPPARKLTLRPQHRQQGPPPPYPGPSQGGPPHGRGRNRAGQYEMQKV